MKRFFLLFSAAVIGLLGVLMINTLLYSSRQVVVTPLPHTASINAEATLRLAEAIRIPTISPSGETEDYRHEFIRFHQWLESQFPKTHALMTRQVIGEYSLLYQWPGSNPALKPVLYMAHMDVVPADTTDPEFWAHPPFSGDIADGFVWGRGTLDDKASLMGLMEAAETLISQGFQPEQTLYFAFGHDEELGGSEGNQKIVSYLQEQGITLASVLDEGFFVLDGMIPGITAPTAMIGIAEKGFVSLKLTVRSSGGHSATPPPNTAIGILAQAIYQLETHPLRGGLDGILGQTFAVLGAEMPFLKKMIFANLWLFQPVVEKQLAGKPATNALMRTTTAVTMIEGGIKENVLPQQASAVVNFRISPTESIESVISQVQRIVADERVSIERYGSMASEPSKVSATDSEAYLNLEKTIRQYFPGAITAPANVVGATDSRHYQPIADNLYRFMPVVLNKDDVARFHGHNERISVADYDRLIRFYIALLSGGTLTP